jgi:hypothetical protein
MNGDGENGRWLTRHEEFVELLASEHIQFALNWMLGPSSSPATRAFAPRALFLMVPVVLERLVTVAEFP